MSDESPRQFRARFWPRSFAALAAQVAGLAFVTATRAASDAPLTIDPTVVEAQDDEGTSAPPVAVRVAHLVYGETGQSSVCFATGYLDLLARETSIRTHREPVAIELQSDELFQYPFAVMSGEGDFMLAEEQVDYLRQYLERGGFLLASAGCSNAAWNEAFSREFARAFPDAPLEELSLEDEVFQAVFRIDRLRTKTHRSDVHLYGLRLNGRLVMVYSPEGLNDTGNAGGGCCCCGGNEIRNAKYINANVLAYALQH